MTTEPWGGYMPEINAGRLETGTGVATWMASGAMWTDFTALVGEAMAVMVGELATIGVNWNGTAPIQLTGVTGPFMAWLAEMEVIATSNALACFAVASAYATAQGAMAPVPEVNANRISEAIAVATNFLGVNSGLIAALNADYARMWGQNGATMMTYDEACQAATIPRPVSPPPPLANAASSGAMLGEVAAQQAINQGIGESTDAATQALSQGVEDASSGAQAAGSPESMMSSMLGSVGQFANMPSQMGSSLTQPLNSLTQPINSLTQPFQSLMGQLGGQTTDAGSFGLTGPPSAAFTGFNSAADAGGASAGGGGIPLGGGLGGSMLAHGSYMGASGAPVKSGQVFTGVSTRPTMGTVAPGGFGGGAAGGGGIAPMMHGAGSGGTNRPGAAVISTGKNTESEVAAREARAMFR